MKKLSIAVYCAGIVCLGSVGAAETYPIKPIRMVVPAAPGGVTDIAARAVGARLAELLGQPVVVDNRAGAGGVIGTEMAAKAAADGYTLLTVFDSFVSNPHVFKNVPYDTLKDFAPLTLLIRGPQLFVVHPRLGVKSLKDFIAFSRAKGAMNFATAGPATSSRLSVELFKTMSGLDAVLVHYKGGGPALNELLGGHVDAMIASAGLVLPHAQAGRLAVLAVTSKERSALVPGTPAVSEFYPEFEVQSWVGVFAPAATPRAIVERLNAELVHALAQPEVKERFSRLGYDVVGNTPQQFAQWLQAESGKWGKLIRERGITAE